MSERGWIRDASSVGTRDGGSFELPLLMVTELDDAGLIAMHELYDHDRIDDALARFEEIKAAEPRGAGSRLANKASRALDRSVRCFNARDWDGMVATFAPEHGMDDRRKLVRLEVNERQFLENDRAFRSWKKRQRRVGQQTHRSNGPASRPAGEARA